MLIAQTDQRKSGVNIVMVEILGTRGKALTKVDVVGKSVVSSVKLCSATNMQHCGSIRRAVSSTRWNGSRKGVLKKYLAELFLTVVFVFHSLGLMAAHIRPKFIWLG